MPDVNENLQTWYAEGRAQGYLDKNPAIHDWIAEGVKKGYLRDLSGGSVYSQRIADNDTGQSSDSYREIPYPYIDLTAPARKAKPHPPVKAAPQPAPPPLPPGTQYNAELVKRNAQMSRDLLTSGATKLVPNADGSVSGYDAKGNLIALRSKDTPRGLTYPGLEMGGRIAQAPVNYALGAAKYALDKNADEPAVPGILPNARATIADMLTPKANQAGINAVGRNNGIQNFGLGLTDKQGRPNPGGALFQLLTVGADPALIGPAFAGRVAQLAKMGRTATRGATVAAEATRALPTEAPPARSQGVRAASPIGDTMTFSNAKPITKTTLHPGMGDGVVTPHGHGIVRKVREGNRGGVPVRIVDVDLHGGGQGSYDANALQPSYRMDLSPD